ncbi:nuclear transport factor 2 family protein [Thalassotalea fusca]
MAITDLFSSYVAAFKQYNLSAVMKLYSRPCLLATPDEVKWLTSDDSFNDAFSEIFAQLQGANMADIVSPRASYNQMSDTLINACVDWQFIDANQQVFTTFCAFYVIHKIDAQWRIVNVMSYDEGQYQQLAHSFKF